MSWKGLLLGSTGLTVVVATSGAGLAQTQLPEVKVTAPSPIVTRPAVRTPAAPAAAPATTRARTRARAPTPTPTPRPTPPTPAAEPPTQPGTLPIITDQFATVTVVPAEEIQRSTGTTLGDVMFTKPGITSTTFAPGAASRPVVRGLDNYRVRIQENGIASGDVSEIGEDHAVTIDPLIARQVEVIRGPATLRWGSQAIGGVVSVENNRIPTFIPPRGVSGEFRTGYTTVDRGREGLVLLDAGGGNFAMHADAFARRAEDYRIPGYPYLFPPDPAPFVDGEQPNSWVRRSGQSVGASYVFDRGFIGAAVSQFSSLYGIPGIELTETNTRIDMMQTKWTSKGEYRPPSSAIDAIRFWLGASDYKHHELAFENGFDGIQQTFTNLSTEGRVEVQLAPLDLWFAQLTTAVGVQASRVGLNAPATIGGGLFDPNLTRTVAGFVFNEFKFTDTLKMQVAGRIEQARILGSSPDFPADLVPTEMELLDLHRNRDFKPKSGAIGFLKDLPWGMVWSLTGQYVERAPRAPELFSKGVHEATGTFDIGNPDLKIEAAKTVEMGLRRAKGPLRFEVTGYYTRFNGFIFRRLTGITCDDDFASCGTGTELNQAVYTQRDAIFRGGEFNSNSTWRRCGPAPGASKASMTSCVPPSPTAVMCRAFPLTVWAAACSGGTVIGLRACSCCMPSHRTISPRRDADRRLQSAQGRVELHQEAQRPGRPLRIDRRRFRQQPA